MGLRTTAQPIFSDESEIDKTKQNQVHMFRRNVRGKPLQPIVQ